MTPKFEQWLVRVMFWAMTLSVASYSVGFWVYHSRLATLTSALADRSVLKAGCLGLALVWIWFAETVKPARLKALTGIFMVWFIIVAWQAFYSIPSFGVVLATGLALEAATLIVRASFDRAGGH